MSKSSSVNNSSIAVVIAGNTYVLRPDDPQGLRDMPANDRDQLIGLLEALKAQRNNSQRAAQAALAGSADNTKAAQSAADATQGIQPGERLGEGDIDTIMARLIMEERQQRKQALTPATIYKFAAAIIVAIVLVGVLFR